MKNNYAPNRSIPAIKWLILTVVMGFSVCVHAARVKVTLMSPEPPDNLFWGQAIEFAKAVAEDLDIDLTVVHPAAASSASSYIMKRLGMSVLNNEVKPDYLLTGYWRSSVDTFVSALKIQNMRVFIFNSDVIGEDKNTIGTPRDKYPNWIGHMHPDEQQGGYLLADTLIQTTLSRQENARQSIVAICGDNKSQVSSARLEGLQNRVANDANAALSESFNTIWTREGATSATSQALTKFPDTNIVWTVSGDVAMGSIQALKAKGKRPGKDILVGGFDWSSEGLQAVKDGELTVIMGGHFMEAGWALVLINDYHNGIDFIDELGIEHITKMQAITETNIDQYLRNLGDRDWHKIDFKKFSKKHNPQLKNYDFSLNAIFASME